MYNNQAIKIATFQELLVLTAPCIETEYSTGDWHIAFKQFLAVHQEGLDLMEKLKQPYRNWRRDIRVYLHRHTAVVGNISIARDRLTFYRRLKNIEPTQSIVLLQQLLNDSSRFYNTMRLLTHRT